MKNISKKDEEFSVFIEKLNIAYKERESFGIKFSMLEANDVDDRDKIFILEDNHEIVSGACLFIDKGQAKLRHVWSDVNKKRKGYAKTLLANILSDLEKQQVKEVFLSVINNYYPAVNLYRSLGFKKVSYFANEVGQPYGIMMVKNLSQNKYRHTVKCAIKSLFAKIKYSLLFNKNSKPRLVGKILYRRK